MMKSTLLLVILLIVLAEGSANVVTPGGGVPSGPSLPEDCEGRMEFIESPSNETSELTAVGEQKGNLRASSRQSYKAKSYGNCCWIMYSR